MSKIINIDGLKSSMDIVEVIGGYRELKKEGANFKFLCPFHSDTKPSAVVSPTKQIFTCFTCGAGGDAIKFVMDYTKMNFVEAIEKIASISHYTLQYGDDNKYEKKDKILGLVQSFVKKGIEDIDNSNNINIPFSSSQIEEYQIGFVGGGLVEHLKQNFIDIKDINSIRLPQPSTFTIPIRNKANKIIGFGGVGIGGGSGEKVRMNSYSFFGLNIGKIAEENRVVIEKTFQDVMADDSGIVVTPFSENINVNELKGLVRVNPYVTLKYDDLNDAMLLTRMGFEGDVEVKGITTPLVIFVASKLNTAQIKPYLSSLSPIMRDMYLMGIAQLLNIKVEELM